MGENPITSEGVRNMLKVLSGLDYVKESLLYISMLFVMAGGDALLSKEYVVGGVLLLVGAGLVSLRAILKKLGYLEDLEEREGKEKELIDSIK